MSSYLNIFLVPKRKDKKEKKRYLLLSSYSRSSDVYEVFCETINHVRSENEDRYTVLTKVNMLEILDDLNESIKSVKERLDLYDKYARDNPDYIQEIISTREVLQDYQSTCNTVEALKNILDDTVDGHNDFEEMCCNIN